MKLRQSEHIRSSDGSYSCNVAESDHVRVEEISDWKFLILLCHLIGRNLWMQLLAPMNYALHSQLYTLYDVGEAQSFLAIGGIATKTKQSFTPPAVVYAAENDNRAASRLQEACRKYLSNSLDEK